MVMTLSVSVSLQITAVTEKIITEEKYTYYYKPLPPPSELTETVTDGMIRIVLGIFIYLLTGGIIGDW